MGGGCKPPSEPGHLGVRGVCVSVCVTGHAHAAASGPAFVLAQLSVQFRLCGSGRRGRQVGGAHLPEEEGGWNRKLLLEKTKMIERERKDKTTR